MSTKVCYLLVSQMRLLNFLLHLPRQQKRVVQITLDSLIILSCYALAMFLRLDSWDFARSAETWYVLIPVIPVTLGVFVKLGLYRAVLRYIGNQAIATVMAGVCCSALTMFIASQSFGWFVPRSVPAIYALLAMVFLGGMRVMWRALYLQATATARTRVIIYGAGASGRQVVASLRNGQEYLPAVFVDDDPALHGSLISGLHVFGLPSLPALLDLHATRMVLLAMPRLSQTERRAILKRLEPYNVKIQTIPGMADLVTGRATLDDIRAVSVEELLGRAPVDPVPELLSAHVTQKSVMVTGAGGSIGSELCRQILSLKPKQLVLFEQSEFNLYKISQELDARNIKLKTGVELVQILGSIQHPECIETAMRGNNVQTVYHAAAYKHVPLIESNVIQGVRNNVFGTLHTVEAAIATEVEAFIMVSTDKAVRPTNVMGATKRIGELICQAYAATTGKTMFSIVRFGNVLGSSGSVIPLFKAQIARGGPVTVTDPNVTRYFMTIPEAAQLVVQAGALGKSGDIFVLDMGDPVTITELAQKMIRLSGLTPWIAGKGASGDIEIRFTGLRPGEKLYEELMSTDEVQRTAHPRIMIAKEPNLPIETLRSLLDSILMHTQNEDHAEITKTLQNAPIAYVPNEAERPE